MKLQLATLFCLVSILTYGQKPPLKFGDVSLDEVKMVRYEPDTSASAVILYDFGTSEIRYNDSDNWFKLEFERIIRIKILKKDGYSFADFEERIYNANSAREKLTGLKVSTYNLENGKLVETKMKSDGSFTEKYDQNTDIVKFTAPNVKEGSVIEATYKISSDFLNYFRDWEFQSTVPTVWSEYRAYIPEYFNYDKFSQGYVPFAINESKDIPKSIVFTTKDRPDGPYGGGTTFQTDKINYIEKYYRWASKNVPAFKDEPFMTTYHDYISKINFELSYYKMPNQPIKQIMGTWDDLNRSMLESDYFGAVVKGSGFLKKITEELIAGRSTSEEKIAAIYNYVKSNVEWDGTNRKFLNDTNLKDALDKKKGSSAHINLMLTSMLQKAGFDANPVIISTRNNGFVRESFALSSQFNYVITHVAFDDKSMLLDATDRLLPVTTLPSRCLNGRGYMIASKNHGWVPITPSKTKTVVTASLVLSSGGNLDGQLKISSDGYAARSIRNSYLNKGEADYVKDLEHGKSFRVTKSEFANVNEIDKPTEETHTISMEDSFDAGQTIFINPFIYLAEGGNPFKLEKREYPVDFGSPIDRTVLFSLTIPDDYIIDEIPESKIYRMSNNSGRYLYNTQVTGNKITVTSMFSIAKNIFTQTEYPELREFYNLVVAKQAEQIVLKKK